MRMRTNPLSSLLLAALAVAMVLRTGDHRVGNGVPLASDRPGYLLDRFRYEYRRRRWGFSNPAELLLKYGIPLEPDAEPPLAALREPWRLLANPTYVSDFDLDVVLETGDGRIVKVAMSIRVSVGDGV